MIPQPVFAYLDYRLFLKNRFKELKSADRLTLEQFAKKASIRSPGLVKMIVEGKRNLTRETAIGFAKALGLKKREIDFFVTLVTYNQTDDPNEKAKCFEALVRLRPRSKEFRLNKRENRYFSRYHYVCIREMVALPDFNEDPEWIGARCYPPISATQVKEALETLLKLGLVVRDQNGKLIQGEDLQTHGHRDTQAVGAFHFHETALDKARKALIDLKQEERHFHSLTIPLNPEILNELIDGYTELRQRIIKKVEENKSQLTEVYQANFQLFPATKKELS